MQRVVQRLATVLYEVKCIQQEAQSDSAERFHLVHYKVQCLIAIYLFLITFSFIYLFINPLKPELNPICYLLALLGAHHFLHVSRIRVKLLTLGY